MTDEKMRSSGGSMTDCDDMAIRKAEADAAIQAMADGLVRESPLLLTVEVATREEAFEILRWLHSPDKPMKSTLQSVQWDHEAVTKLEAKAIRMIRTGGDDG